MNNNLKNLNKKELLSIIGKMKKKDLIKVIESKIGGDNSNTNTNNNKINRIPIKYDESKIKNNNNNNNLEQIMENDNIYNRIYNKKKNNVSY